MFIRRRIQIASLCFAALSASISSSAMGQDAGKGEIKLGQSAPLSGPASSWGVYSRVEVAYFKRINDQGGINGRKVSFILLDNALSPTKAVEASRRLVDEYEILAEVGTIGAATNAAIQRYLNSKGVPQLFLSSGGSRFNDPKKFPWTVPFYPAFEHEGAAYAGYLAKTIPDAKIAILYQNDDYGKDLLKGFKNALGRAGAIVAERSYELSDPTIDSQIVFLAASGANVFMNFSTPKFIAQSVRKVNELKWTPTQFVPSSSSSIQAVLKPIGLENCVGILSLKFLKEPGDPTWARDPAMLEYFDFMKQYASKEDAYDGVAASGYLNAQLVEHVLRAAGDDLTRENILKIATSIKNLRLSMLMPMVELTNSSEDYQLYHSQNFPVSRFNGERWVEVQPAAAR